VWIIFFNKVLFYVFKEKSAENMTEENRQEIQLLKTVAE